MKEYTQNNCYLCIRNQRSIEIMTGLESTLRTYRISDDNTILIGLILMFVLFTFVLYRSRAILAYKIKTYFSSRQIYAVGDILSNDREQVAILLLVFIGILNTCLFLFINAIEVNNIGIDYTLFLHIFLTILSLSAIQICTYIFVNWVFFTPEVSRRWITSYIYLLAAVSIAIIPFTVIRIFYHGNCAAVMTFCIATVVILQKIILFCKLYVNFKPKKYGRLLFFLYFCGVEIMPTLITMQILQQMKVIG